MHPGPITSPRHSFRPLLPLGLFAATVGFSACGLKVQALRSLQTNGSSSEIVCDASGAPFGGGSGTSGDPYAICTTDQFLAIANGLASHYVLARDLDFASTTYVPLGSAATPFTGELDGNSKKISNVTYANAADAEAVGLFRESGTGAEFHHLSLENVAMTGAEYTAGLVGKVNGSTFHDLNFKSLTIVGKATVGGIAAFFVPNADVNDDDITRVVMDDIDLHSSADGTTVGNTWDTGIGAIVGRLTVTGKVNHVDITNGSSYWDPAGTNVLNWTHVGGMVGYSGQIQLEYSSYQGTVVGGFTDVGGVIGDMDGNATSPGHIDHVRVWNTTVTGTRETGGIAGHWNRSYYTGGLSPLTNSSFEGTVNTGPSGAAGGLAGVALVTDHERNFVRATINGTNYVGGLYGITYYPWGVNGVLNNSFVGTVNANGDYAGLIAGWSATAGTQLFTNNIANGSVVNANGASANTHYDTGLYSSSGGPTYTSNYYRSSTVSGYSANYASPLSDVQMADSSNFAGFDFTNVWVMPLANPHAGVLAPVLRHQCGYDGVVCP